MTHKERFFTAIHHEEPDMVPISAGLDMKFVEMLSGKKAAKVEGAHYGGGLEGERTKSATEFREAHLRNQELLFEATQKLGADLYSVSDYNIFPVDYVPRRLDAYTYVDFWGKVYRLNLGVNTNYWMCCRE